MSPRYIRPVCVALLLAAFAIDLATPQAFVAAILLNAPIALSSLALDRRLTQGLLVAALAANLAAGYANGLADGHHWDSIAIGNRIIAGLSFLLVGFLSIASQTAAQRAGELAGRQERASRWRIVGRAVDAVRASVNAELIERAVAREACSVFDASIAWAFAFSPSTTSPTTYLARAGASEVEVSSERPAAEILSLLERMASRREPLVVTGADPLGRLVLNTLGVESALAATIADRDVAFGVLVVGRSASASAAATEELLRYYVQQTALALGRAALFEQLAARNDELGRLNGALVERSDVIRDIVFAMSHDLRTPLAATGMTMRQALAGSYGELPAQYLEIVRRMVTSNDELQRLAETLLLISRYESGDRSTRREAVAATTVAEQTVAELEPLWREKGVAVAAFGEPGLLAFADPSEFRRALVNLVANAIAFTPAGGSVEVRTEGRDGRVVVVVDDTGFGVPLDERDRLFERQQPASSRAGAGSGLGLYIVKLIAESHGGAVGFAPRPAGGSRFTFEIPAVRPPDLSETASAAERRA